MLHESQSGRYSPCASGADRPYVYEIDRFPGSPIFYGGSETLSDHLKVHSDLLLVTATISSRNDSRNCGSTIIHNRRKKYR